MLVLPVVTMKISERTLRISASSLLALLMVSASYLLSGPSFLTRSIANAGSTEELLKEYAEKDTDTDGLPDWQEALYNTDPNNPDSDGDGLTDGEAAKAGKLTPQTSASQLPTGDNGVALTPEQILAEIPGVDPAPGSITEQFGEEFLQKYMDASNGQPMDEATQDALTQRLLAEFSAKAAKQLGSTYALVSVRTNNAITTESYSASLENILTSNDVPDLQPLDLMAARIVGNDSSAQQKLITVSNAYKDIAAQLRAMQVPARLAGNHVELVRSFDSLAKSTGIAADYEKDPLATMGALSIYTSSAATLSNSLTVLATTLLANGEPGEGQPGFIIVSLARLSTL